MMKTIQGRQAEAIRAAVKAANRGTYFVQYGDHEEWFVAHEADDASHAVEQANDATGGAHVHAVFRGEPDDSWVSPPSKQWTVIFLLHNSDDDEPGMFMEAAIAPNVVAAIEAVRDRLPEGVEENVRDIITIEGEHSALGPSQPWWRDVG